MTEVYIYALCEPDDTTAVRYIGQTRHDPLWRYYMHRTGLKTPGKAAWLAALDEAHRHPTDTHPRSCRI